MLGGLDPRKMAEAQKISGRVSASIRIDHEANTMLILFNTDDPEALIFVKDTLLVQLPTVFAQQLGAFFAIKGEIVDVNKPKG